MSIKAAELQIGDWAIHDYYKKPIQIKTIPSAEQIYHPITLTKEILEKNGWTFMEGQDYSTFPVPSKWTYQFVPFALRVDGETYSIANTFTINYVHELQRALRCCGLWDLAEKFKI